MNLCDTDQQDDENFNNAVDSVEGEIYATTN